VKRIPISLAIGAVTALLGTAAAGAQALDASTASAPTVKLASTSIGKILVAKSNHTLYMFTRDKRDKDACVKVSMCTGTWPPYTTSGKPTAGPGVKSSLLGTIKLSSGRKQVTYAGHPLYTYAFDSGPKQTDYVGASQFGGKWYAVSSAGKTVK
jgi:predicted lipoprotein with Yx(FWY)xxD motif